MSFRRRLPARHVQHSEILLLALGTSRKPDMKPIRRRDFLKTSAASTFGFTVLPSYLVTGAQDADGRLPPSKRINLACIGVGGRGSRVVPGICQGGKAQPVAFCDVDFKARRGEVNLKKYPDVRRFKDFRVMMEKVGKDCDAVSVATPDHTHFPAAILAMSMGKHVYVEKPLAHSYRECDLLIRAAKKYGVVTQMGNQGHTSGGLAQFAALVDCGAIRNITRIEAWKSPGLFFMDKKRRISEFPGGEKVPESLDWDLWCGPAEKKPFSRLYHPFDWRAFYLYGNGMLGDWGAHIIDFAHDFLQLGQPTRLTPHLMDDHNEVIFPLSSHLTMKFPARGKHPALDLTWRDGANCRPEIPEQFWSDDDKGVRKPPKLGGAGTVLHRDDGEFAVIRGSHSGRSRIIPADRSAEYEKQLKTPNPKNNHLRSFTEACLGNDKTRSPFRIAGELTKTLMLGVICQRLNEELSFDRDKERFVNHDRADALLDGPAPRKGWEDFYKLA